MSASRRPSTRPRPSPNRRAPSTPSRNPVPPLVLVGDDNDAVRAAVASLLSNLGYRLAVAAEGEETLQLARLLEPSLLIIDVNMPGLDGLGVARHVRASKTTSCTPIIMISANGETRDVEAGLQAGADTYLVKPFQMEELLDSLATLLQRPG